MKVHMVVLGCLLIGSIVLSGCVGQQSTQSFKRSYSVSAQAEVTVSNTNGRVVVSGWNGSQVNVSAEKVSFGGVDELNRVEIHVAQDEHLIAIETRYTGSSLNQPSVNYVIRVPFNNTVRSVVTQNGPVEVTRIRGDVNISTSNGGVTIEDVTGTVWVATSNGHIDVRGARGIRGLKTSNGAITADLQDFPPDTQFTTSNGAVTLSINTALNASLDFSTSNGRITTDNVPLNNVNSGQSRLQANLGSGGKKLTVRTSNGNIILSRLG